MSAPRGPDPGTLRIISPSYLSEKAAHKPDLLRRLTKLRHVLEQDDRLEPDHLTKTATSLLPYFHHKDKQVRLLALVSSLEILAIFAPDCPYDDAEILSVFRQLVTQLASLATVTDPTHEYYPYYERVLNLLAQVRIGVILVEVTKFCCAASGGNAGKRRASTNSNNKDSDDHDDSDSDSDYPDLPSGQEALELLAEFVQALLHCLRHDHPPTILELAHKALVAVLEEYDPQSVPVAVLDELLLCIGQGPVIIITENAAANTTSNSSNKKKKTPTRAAAKKKSSSNTPSSQASLLIQRKVPNPSYVCAAKVLTSALNRLSTPIATLLNGLLNGDSATIERSNITIDPPVTTANNNAADAPNHHDSVYTIIRQLYHLAPSILTTVIGTLSHGLVVPEEATRLAATKLLGDLFAANNNTTNNSSSSHTNLAANFRLIFKEWLGRRNDMSVSIRRCMVDCLVKILAAHSGDAATAATKGDAAAATTTATATSHWTIRDDVTQTLTSMIKEDPDAQVRMDAIFAVCDWIYRCHNPASVQVSPLLLQAIGTRVSSKHKEERKNAMTGLGQLYFRQYLREKVKALLPKNAAGSDSASGRSICDADVDISSVLEILHENCHLRPGKRSGHRRKKRHHSASDDDEEDYKDIDEETYGWIPAKIFECAYFTDAMDSDMRSRVIQVLDEVLLGSDTSSSSYKHMSKAARAVGFTIILNSISDGDLLMHHNNNDSTQTNAFKYMRQLFGQRAALQKSLYTYLEARAAMKELAQGSEDFFTAQANVLDLLEKVAALVPPAPGNDQAKVLNQFHKARDKQVFRQLAMAVDPKQSNKVRAKALDDLPKRIKSMGLDDATGVWVKNLVRRCCMGDFINASTVGECVRLAHESFGEEDVIGCAALLSSVKTVVDIFPLLGGVPETFSNLTELFSNCRSVDDKELKRELVETGILTTLSSILAVAAPMPKAGDNMDLEEDVVATQFQKELMQLCTRDGTPEQARHAVYTLAKLLGPKQDVDLSQSLQEKKKSFSQVLNALTAPSKLVISSSENSIKLVRILSALSALSECASEELVTSDRGQKAMKFALETVLMGRNRSDDMSGDESTTVPEAKSPHSARKQRSMGSARKHVTPEMASSLLEDENLSIPCRTLCAAIDFLVCSIRSALLHSITIKAEGHRKLVAPFIGKVFHYLVQIIRDQGLPPSDCDRRLYEARQDRAALRQCAAVHLFRLCDTRLGLEDRYLNPAGWHSLADILLDEERVVRETCMEEMSLMMTGKGVYSSANSRPASPALRFVALIVFCTEGDSSAACGNASKVGNASHNIKSSALACVANLRKVCDAYYNQCKANGRESDFDTAKTGLMPEYMVPYAIHLLTHRRETPFAGGVVDADADTDAHALADDEAQNKVLRKRLRLLLEPLIMSLGENADNISFLLRMTEMLGKSFRPVDVAFGLGSLIGNRLSLDSASSANPEPKLMESKREVLLEAKLKSVSTTAREILLSFVKKDTNLNPYPGSILLPSFLFKKVNGTLRRESGRGIDSGTSSTKKSASSQSSFLDTQSPSQTKRKRSISPTSRSLSSKKKSPQATSEHLTQESAAANADDLLSSPKQRNVHFSPDVRFRPGSAAHHSVLSAETGSDHFGDVSPIAQSGSPSSSNTDSPSQGTHRSSRLSCTAPTLGTTPPSILRGSTLQSTAPNTLSSRKSLHQVSTMIQSDAVGSRARPKISSEDSGVSADDEGAAFTQSQAADSLDWEEDIGTRTFADVKKPSRSSRRGSNLVQKCSTQSQDEPSKQLKKEPPAAKKTASLKGRKPTNKGVPTQIKINRVEMPPSSMDSEQQPAGKKIAQKRRAGRSSKAEDDDDDLDFNFENAGNAKNKKAKGTFAKPKRAVKSCH